MYFARRPSWSSGESGVSTMCACGSHAASIDSIAASKLSRALRSSLAGVTPRGVMAWAEREARASATAMALRFRRGMINLPYPDYDISLEGELATELEGSVGAV